MLEISRPPTQLGACRALLDQLVALLREASCSDSDANKLTLCFLTEKSVRCLYNIYNHI